MTNTFKLNGREVSKAKARAAWLIFDMERGSDPVEGEAIFAMVSQQDMDGEQAREYLLDAGLEVFFHGTNSRYDH